MHNIKTVSVVGGDTRQIYTARRLEEYGFEVRLFGLERFGGGSVLPPRAETLEQALRCDAVVLPLPCSKNGKTLNAPFAETEIPLREVADLAAPDAVFFTGMAAENFAKTLSAGGAAVFDYFRDEALTVKNALLTAEGILGIILEKTNVTVWRMNAAVTGYGRVGYFLCRALKALGAEVTVYARNPAQLAKAQTAGLATARIDRLPEQTYQFDVIVNTVPAPVVTAAAVENARKDCLLIETAGAPYGVDFDACKLYGKELVKAFSLPGRTAPKTAGILIAETVFGMMKEANLLWNNP
ncbi:MAG: hypothetical protein IJK98_03485 [Clostridia bacterium]|nr:hypothetical protein [Clostridia bacterium]